MSPRKPTGRPRGRPPGRGQPRHRLTPVWKREIDAYKHTEILLRIAMEQLKHKKQEEPPAPAADHQEGGEHHDSN